MKIFKTIDATSQFVNDLKRLKKRFRTLDEDLEEFIRTQLNLFHKCELDNGGIHRIEGTGYDYPPCFIAKKFACKSLPKTGVKSGIRVVYVYWEEDDHMQLIEIFFKTDKTGYNKKRLSDFLKQAP